MGSISLDKEPELCPFSIRLEDSSEYKDDNKIEDLKE